MRFVDTSFWIALQSQPDRNHAAARSLLERGLGPLLTTNLVIGETWTVSGRRRGHAGAVEAIRALRAVPTLTILHVDPDVAVMRRRRMREALAFDGDFSAAGFVELRP